MEVRSEPGWLHLTRGINLKAFFIKETGTFLGAVFL